APLHADQRTRLQLADVHLDGRAQRLGPRARLERCEKGRREEPEADHAGRRGGHAQEMTPTDVRLVAHPSCPPHWSWYPGTLPPARIGQPPDSKWDADAAGARKAARVYTRDIRVAYRGPAADQACRRIAAPSWRSFSSMH